MSITIRFPATPHGDDQQGKAISDSLTRHRPYRSVKSHAEHSNLSFIQKHYVWVGIVLTTLLWHNVVLGQNLPPQTDPTGRFGQPPPITEALPKTDIPQEVLPPLEQTTTPQGAPSSLNVFVKEIRVTGTTVFSPEELSEVAAPYVNQKLTTEDIEEVRQKITRLYIEKGYVSSGATIPDQDMGDGILTFAVVESALTDIQVNGTNWFWPFYFSSRLNSAAGPPVNLNNLRDRMQLFLQDPRIERMNAELQPGTQPGESILAVNVEEASPWKAWLDFNNHQSPTVGAERGLATVSHLNLLGLGDAISFTYGRSKGVDPLIDVSYSIPFTPWDTTLIVQYRKNDFEVVESPFKPLDIESETDIFSISLRQPVYRTPKQEIALTLTGEHLRNENFLLGIPFAFTPGSTSKGKVKISALRFAQEWTHRLPNQVLSARSRFSFGLKVLDATTNSSSNVPDSNFLSWLGQIQGARRLETLNMQVIGRMDLQIANDRLFPLEQYAMGGRFTVRGYRENTIVRENAFLFSAETRIPIWPSKLGDETVQFAPFFDVGRSWNAKGSTPDPKTLASVGAGLRFTFRQTRFPVFKNAFANIYWGKQLEKVADRNNNLQDQGIHIQVLVEVL